MSDHSFRILNVFAIDGDPFSGNPLCVFEDGARIREEHMQALARQMNLSETTFVLSPTSADASARVRIFTPSFEMPFAGHPTLGTAYVVRELAGLSDRVSLEMKVGVITVTAEGSRFSLCISKPPTTRPAPPKPELAAMLNVSETSVIDEPLWVDTGSEQLVVPLAHPSDVERANPSPADLARLGHSPARASSLVYVWARQSAETVIARFFFLANGSVVEDAATGSACANLGGYLLAKGAGLPVHLQVHQGRAVGRPSRLGLLVDEARRIFVSGDVLQIGRGVITLP